MKQILNYIIVVILIISCAPKDNGTLDMNRWLTANGESIENEHITLSEGDKIVFDGDTKEFINFELSGQFMLSSGAKATLMFHTDNSMTKGYELFFGNGAIDSEIRTGSLTAVRNLFKSVAKDNIWSPFAIKVSGRRIVVEICENRVVDYIEPDTTLRIEEYAQRLLSSGNFAISCQRGNVEFSELKVSVIDDKNIDLARRNSDDTVTMQLQQQLFPLIDYHVHLKGISKEEAYEQSLDNGINYGIAPNCGIGFPITDDDGVKQYCDSTKNMPFLFGMQGEGREWPTTFSAESRALFDYVFTDALTFEDHRGRRTKLWIDSLVHIDIPMEKYMDILVDRTLKVLENEPLDIFVNPTLLPVKIRSHYSKLWTTERMDLVIKALKDNGVALEINDRYEIPSIEFIKRAKGAGIKFTFGTNNVSAADLRGLKYSIRAAIEAGLTKDDMWSPSMR